MTTPRLKAYVVNLRRRADRRARMERVLPAAWDVQFTSDWDGPMDGQAIDPDDLPGFGLYPWEIPSDNPWWCRPLKLGEIGCAISHWMCWQKAAKDGADPALILEDDAVLADHCAELLQARLARLSIAGPHWDLLYLGRWALDDEDRPVAEGIVQPGFSYCTFGYLLSASGLAAVLSCGFERALIPVDELLPALYMGHPREDVRSLYPKRLRAYALEPPLVAQLPKDQAGSDTETSAFAPSRRLQLAGSSQ
ncbi:MAG TPA: glycosyltransferase family 25 protein [Streptosporangiaceae bacterium]|jgi:glycosyl transferase family 25|nr:glycosyltransferase family 25 protein [Streptosporangiaceae bacterium]